MLAERMVTNKKLAEMLGKDLAMFPNGCEWLMQKQSEMEANAANLSTAERKKLDSIRKQIDECREYHDRLHVIADEQIAFDLDDGVVVNYAKFGDVLAKLK